MMKPIVHLLDFDSIQWVLTTFSHSSSWITCNFLDMTKYHFKPWEVEAVMASDVLPRTTALLTTETPPGFGVWLLAVQWPFFLICVTIDPASFPGGTWVTARVWKGFLFISVSQPSKTNCSPVRQTCSGLEWPFYELPQWLFQGFSQLKFNILEL